MLIDLHCHPSLKIYFFNIDLFETHLTTRDFNPFSIRVDLPKLQQGNVNAIMASHYLPEINYTTECPGVDWLYGGIKFLAPDVIDKIENNHNFNSPFEQTMQMIKALESKVHEARSKGFNINIARNFEDLEKGLLKESIMILHTIEGGHSLGRSKNSYDSDIANYLRNLISLKEVGVCMITLAHFFENDLVPCVEGIPPKIRKLLRLQPRNTELSITAIGEEVIRKILDLGIVVDLTHCAPKARDRIFEINNNIRPLIFSHVGVRKFFNNIEFPNDNLMNPSDEEILKIKDCNGVIGVTFNNYWLTGKEEESLFHFEPGLDYIYKTIEYIKEITGSYEYVALGSDFDGLTDPPDDIKDCSKFPDLINFLLDKGISTFNVNKITGENILRVLREGWL